MTGTPTPTTQRSPTRTGTALPSQTVVAGCPGDCLGDGRVTIDELIAGVRIALGSNPLSICPSFDINGNGLVTIDELIQAVGVAGAGCP